MCAARVWPVHVCGVHVGVAHVTAELWCVCYRADPGEFSWQGSLSPVLQTPLTTRTLMSSCTVQFNPPYRCLHGKGTYGCKTLTSRENWLTLCDLFDLFYKSGAKVSLTTQRL